VATILGQGASLLVLGMAPSLAWLFVGRALAGICGANLSTAAAYIADVTPEEGRARGMGIIGAGFGLGFIFGPAIGGLLSHWGYGTPMFVAAGLALVAGLFAWVFLPEPPLGRAERQQHRRALSRAAIRESLGDSRTRIAILLFFVLTLAATQTETAFALFVQARHGYGAREAGLLLAFTGLVMAGVQGGLIGRLSRRFGEARLAALGALSLAVALVVFATTWQLPLLVASLAFLGLGMGLTHPSLQSLASRGAAPGRQGATMGVYQSAGSLARIVGPPFGGFLYDSHGISIPFLAAAGLSLLAFAAMLSWSARGFVREATLTFRQGGLRGTLQRYGWKLFAGFFLFYLVRDVTLYIVLPYLAARGVLSLWR
jgi:predicted MFS family arabinose efflux permease